MEWIRSANINKFNIIKAFEERTILDWTKGPFNISKGDIVYLYVGVPYSRIMYKTLCIEDKIDEQEVIDDRQYWVNSDEFSSAGCFVRLKKIRFIDDVNLSLDAMTEKKLIKGRIQGAYRSDRYFELFNYIHSIMDVKTENDYDFTSTLTETEREMIIKARVGQGIYREKLIRKFKGKCAICGLNYKYLLIASHVKEWSDSNEYERLDEDNGLLLCALHDALFDKHLISFEDNGKILISKELTERDRMLLNINQNQCIKISKGTNDYMKYHRNKFIKKLKGLS